jgi:glucose-1-phosphate adenylyltransferase
VNVGAGVHLGFGGDNEPNALEPDKLNTGITVVGKGAHIPPGVTIGRNVVIVPKADEDIFETYGDHVPSGATVGVRQ